MRQVSKRLTAKMKKSTSRKMTISLLNQNLSLLWRKSSRKLLKSLRKRSLKRRSLKRKRSKSLSWNQ